MLAERNRTLSSPPRHHCPEPVPSGVLTPDLQRRWDEDGWWVIPGVIPADDLSAAQDAMNKLFPTADEMEHGADIEHHARRQAWDAKWPEFSFHNSRLNALGGTTG
jgi:hypothetical protein